MVIDTSALMAVVLGELDGEEFSDTMAAAAQTSMSAVSLVEASIVAEGRLGHRGPAILATVLQEAGIVVKSVDLDQAQVAVGAWRRFGKGRHPARLNLGDCFSYALARSLDEPLLFKGEEFAQTDIRSVRH